MVLYFLYHNSMDVEHEFTLDDILLCAKAFGILNDKAICFPVEVDKIGNVGTSTFNQLSVAVLCRDKFILDLFSEVGYKTSSLHHLQLIGTAMLFPGSVAAGTKRTILVFVCR